MPFQRAVQLDRRAALRPRGAGAAAALTAMASPPSGSRCAGGPRGRTLLLRGGHAPASGSRCPVDQQYLAQIGSPIRGNAGNVGNLASTRQATQLAAGLEQERHLGNVPPPELASRRARWNRRQRQHARESAVPERLAGEPLRAAARRCKPPGPAAGRLTEAGAIPAARRASPSVTRLSVRRSGTTAGRPSRRRGQVVDHTAGAGACQPITSAT
jgi:hypothetical protein